MIKIKNYILKSSIGIYFESGIPYKFGDFIDNNNPSKNKYVYIKKGIYKGKIGIIKDYYHSSIRELRWKIYIPHNSDINITRDYFKVF